ncbi:hypothetical protein ACIQU1_20010 [Streptomyces angustmyceticus]|uniref:hypothetical protein n=1 Tax=Streptomyces angustmyceticus TaxID=285578 RepID=UPI0038218DFD
MADEPVDVSDVAEIADTRLEAGDWDIGVFLTDLPSRAERNPVSTEVDPEHRVALISLPALGSRRLRRRGRQAVIGVVRHLAAQDEEPLASAVVGRPASGEIPGASAPRCGAWAATSAWRGKSDAVDAQEAARAEQVAALAPRPGLPGSPGRVGQQPAYESDDGWWSSLPVRPAGPGRPSVECWSWASFTPPQGSGLWFTRCVGPTLLSVRGSPCKLLLGPHHGERYPAMMTGVRCALSETPD